MTNEILSKILFHSKKTRTLIGLHRIGNPDDFTVGYVVDYNDSFVVIQHVTKYGVEDGLHIEKLAKLEKIETDEDYIKSCQILLKNQNLLPKQSMKKVKFNFSEAWQYDLLNNNSYKGELIAFELDGENLFNFGYLVDYDEVNILMHLVSESGISQGTNVYHLEDIISFGFDTMQCRKRKTLFNLKKKASS
jgi:hypothetical protein